MFSRAVLSPIMTLCAYRLADALAFTAVPGKRRNATWRHIAKWQRRVYKIRPCTEHGKWRQASKCTVIDKAGCRSPSVLFLASSLRSELTD